MEATTFVGCVAALGNQFDMLGRNSKGTLGRVLDSMSAWEESLQRTLWARQEPGLAVG